ncbi:MAG: TetR/AcrR family transcriptional regulator [Bacteroidia bacterium]|nr:TetR/AcrR family transcriptional regulator [Bacteroidia bacterium]
MKEQKKLEWITAGYEMIAQNGMKSIRIESIARQLNKNKSSFYHYFGDAEIFDDELLEYHTAQIRKFADRAKDCEHIRPDLLNLFIEHKTDLFFHKQLRINRHTPKYKACFERSFQQLEDAIIDKWADFLGLENKTLFARAFLNLIAENFLLQITENTFSYQWLDEYLDEVQGLLKQMGTSPDIGH